MEASFKIKTTYILYLDPFGRVAAWEENVGQKNYVIVERYINVTDWDGYNYSSSSSSEYDYMLVTTMTGESKTLYIRSGYSTDANYIMQDMGIRTSVAATANTFEMENRIIEYSLDSAGRVNDIQNVVDTMAFVDAKYDAAQKCFYGERYEYDESVGEEVVCRENIYLLDNAKVVDATEYFEASSPTQSGYKQSSLSKLLDEGSYDVILIGKTARDKWANVIIKNAPYGYNKNSEFYVATEDFYSASEAEAPNGNILWAPYVLKNGSPVPERLYFDGSVEVYYRNNFINYRDIKKGDVFYCLFDDNGYVERIDLIFRCPRYEDEIPEAADMENRVSLPYVDAYEYEDWSIGFNTDTKIQLIYAPVYKVVGDSVYAAPIVCDENNGYYFDTNAEERFEVNENTTVYSYNWKGFMRNAFSGGKFGANVVNTMLDDDGYGWLVNVPEDKTDLSGDVQMAFMMVVDGVITNALVIENF